MPKTVTEDWRDRERERQKTRTMPVWVNEPFWREHAYKHEGHFVHLSAQNPPLLAYTVDVIKGARDIQTQIKAGRYLAKYFGDVLTAKQIAYLAAWQANGTKPQGEAGNSEVKFATTEDEIVDVYARGPRSCMDGENFNEENSPVRVYAANDLAIAYLEGEAPPNRPDNDVLARCLVWPAKKVMGRVYPTAGNWQADGWETASEHMAAYYALESKLRDQGYSSTYEGDATFNGAKLLRERRNGSFIMPYLDQDYAVDDDGTHFIMREEGEGEYTCQETSGCLGSEREEQYDYWCQNCEEGNHDGTSTVITRAGRGWAVRTAEWCEHCCEHGTFTCDGTNDLYSDNLASVYVNGCTYSEHYAEKNFLMSDYSNEWFDPEEDPTVEMDNGDIWAESEFEEHGFTCRITGERLSNDDEHADYGKISSACTLEEISEHFANMEKEAAE